MCRKNTSLVFFLVSVLVFMLSLAYASVPLYRMFCQTTGYGGTVKRVDAARLKVAASGVTQRSIKVYLNADSMPDVPLEFYPDKRYVKVLTGERKLAFYHVKNSSDQPFAAMAVYNVTPDVAAKYFYKIACFCFSKQVIPPHSARLLPVSFLIDTEIDNDPDASSIEAVTLSYTFFKFNE